ncbi:MAG: helix-turn-helix transcriptional regulator, partial [Proteobacteria bacterium]|nr:helix-turn-helix transcriptional regulator [Pseudomonadota bacterium]
MGKTQRGTYKRKYGKRPSDGTRDQPESPIATPNSNDDVGRVWLQATIGRVTRNVREAKKLTQADIAERIGLSAEFYARIERGIALPSIRTLAKL